MSGATILGEVFNLRCTRRLFDRLPFSVDNSPPHSTTLLGDWYANVIYIDRKPVVLTVAKRTLVPLLVPLAPASALGERLRAALADILAVLQVPQRAIDHEKRAMTEIVVAKRTTVRSSAPSSTSRGCSSFMTALIAHSRR